MSKPDRSRLLWFGLAGVTVVGIAVALLLMSRDAANDAVSMESFEVGGVLRSLAVSDTSLWVARSDRTLAEVDPQTAEVMSETDIPFSPSEMVVEGGFLWIGSVEGERIARVDLQAPEEIEDFRVGRLPQALAVGDDGVFAAALDQGTVRLLDVATGRVTETILQEKNLFPSSLLWAFGDLWIADVVADVVIRLPNERINVGDSPTQLAAGGGSVWVANYNGRTVTRIDPDSGNPGRPILVGGKPGPIVVAGEQLWVLRPGSDSVIRVGLDSGRWDGEVIPVGNMPQDIATGHGFVWIANEDGFLSRAEV